MDTPILVTTEGLSDWFGLSQRRILQLAKEGIIHSTKGVKGGNGRQYDLKECVADYTKYLSDKANGRTTMDEVELKRKKLEADIALKESQGGLHQLKTAIASGQYISVDEVQLDYDKFFITFKTFAMGIPARVVGLIGGSLEPVESRRLEKELGEEINSILEAFVVAGTAEKPAEIRLEGKSGRPRKDKNV